MWITHESCQNNCISIPVALMCRRSDDEVLFSVLHILTKHHYWICLANEPHLYQTVNYWKNPVKHSVYPLMYVCPRHEKLCDQLYRKLECSNVEQWGQIYLKWSNQNSVVWIWNVPSLCQMSTSTPFQGTLKCSAQAVLLQKFCSLI